MGKPLRILLVEDSEDDALLVIREVKKGGYDPEYIRVETAEGMAEALRASTWDVILCDYQMPRFNGLMAIDQLEHSGLDIPLLVVSGTIGEEIAVDAMRKGANDYIMKDRLTRLVPAIERELKDVESRRRRRQAEEELLRSQSLLESAGRMAKFGGWSANLADRVVVWSDQVAAIHESSPGTTLTLDEWTEYIAPEWRDKIAVSFTDCAGKGKPYDEEIEIITSGGKRVWVRTTGEAVRDSGGKIVQLRGAFQDITERMDSMAKLRKALWSTVQAMAFTVETRDPYTAGHQRRVADLSRAIAEEMGLPDDQVEGIRMAAIIHDIGKISVPAEILSKPSELTDIEFSLIKAHARSGYDILKDIEFPWPVARMVLEHHERLDGSGYPGGLMAEELLPESRIIAVADVLESMASHRPYRPSRGVEVALEEIERNSGKLYDPEVAGACLRLFREKGFQLLV